MLEDLKRSLQEPTVFVTLNNRKTIIRYTDTLIYGMDARLIQQRELSDPKKLETIWIWIKTFLDTKVRYIGTERFFLYAVWSILKLSTHLSVKNFVV